MATSIRNYSVLEAGNIGLGQAGSAYLTDMSTTYTPQTGRVVIAIQVIDDCVFGTATTAESSDFTGNAVGGAEGGTNADIFGSDTFPAGITIYGRWTTVQLVTKGAVMLYMGS